MALREMGRDQIDDLIKRFGYWLNPIAGSPSASLETAAFIDSFGTSLMPRSSALMGAAAGMNVLSARAVASALEGLTSSVLPAGASLPVRLGTRALTAGAGEAVMRIPEVEDETLWRAGARSSGHLLRAAAIGGAIYDVGTWLQGSYPAKRSVRPLLTSSLALGGFLYWAARRNEARQEEIERWPVPQVTKVPAALGTAAVVSGVGRGATAAYKYSRDSLIGYLGDGATKSLLGRAGNAAMWGFGLSSLYNAGVGYIGRANEKVDPGYATPPPTPLASGSEESLLPYEDLGQQGRRYVNDGATSELIEEILGEPAKAKPIRAFVGYNSEPIYQTGRAELALAELDRMNAFDREYLLLVSPTGTGWVDHTMIEAAEILARGDIATCCIQYGRFPSFLSLQKVSTGRRQFRLLLWGIQQRLQERSPEKRPKVLVFGESLGAWASSDVVMYQGIAGFDHYGIDRALWFGLPGLAKWSRNGMAKGSSDLVPEGTVLAIDHPDQLTSLPDEEKDELRAVILSHDNDPIAQLVPDIAVKRPDWLRPGEERGRGVPDSMEWIPLLTLWQTAIDAANAMVTVPGEFRSFGHDYRADTARVVADAYRFPPVTEEQMQRLESALRTFEVERAERIKATPETAEEAPESPAQRTEEARTQIAGVPLQVKRTRGAKWAVGRFVRRGDVQ